MSALADLNYIKRIFIHPCGSPSIPVLVETAFPAAAVALIELVTPSALDLSLAAVGKPWFHSKGLKSLLKSGKPMGRQNPLVWTGFLSLAVYRAPLYYPWIIGVGTSFVANWMSMVYQLQHCNVPGAGYISKSLTSLYAFGGGGGTVLINGLEGKECCAVGGNKITQPGGCSVTISYTCTWEPFLGLESNRGPVTTWIEDDQGRQYMPGTTGAPDKDGKQATGGGYTADVNISLGARFYSIRFSVGSGLMGCTGGEVHVSGYGRKLEMKPFSLGIYPFHDNPYPHDPPPYPPCEEGGERRYTPCPEDPFERAHRFQQAKVARRAAGRRIGRTPKPRSPRRPRRKK